MRTGVQWPLLKLSTNCEEPPMASSSLLFPGTSLSALIPFMVLEQVFGRQTNAKFSCRQLFGNR